MSQKKKNKHLTLDDRLIIQTRLMTRESFKSIGKEIGKDPTTISKEVKRNLTKRPSDYTKKAPDGKIIEKESCEQLLSAPYVCNGCKKKRVCKLDKQMYDSKGAHKAYLSLLSEAREGIPLTKEEFWEIDQLVSDGINKGQHLYHILQTHNVKTSQATVYRWLHKGHLSVSKVKFPRIVKFRPRKKKSKDQVPKVIRTDRTYADFLAFCENNDIGSWVEMDTVIGRIGGKTLLTFTLTSCSFFFAFLLDDKTAMETTRAFTCLREDLKKKEICFTTIFKTLLTDNGTEFANIVGIENCADGKQEIRLFFCDPGRSDQKGRAEKNHTLLREILPKGTSFDELTQYEINWICTHINGVKRAALNGKSAYELFAFMYDQSIAKALGVSYIPPEDVLQSPRVLDMIKK